MRKILVTGGAGFIGSHLVDRLVAGGNEVVVLDNLRRGKLSNLEGSKERITFIEADIRDRVRVEQAVAGVDTIFHLAAQSNVIGAVTDLDYSFGTNVQGTFEVLRAAAANSVKRLVFTSSREVYGEPSVLPVLESAPLAPKNAYGASKAAGEAYCRALSTAQFEARVVRLANVYGTRDFDRVIPIFLDQTLRNEPLTLFGGQQILDFVWIDEVVKGLITAASLDEFRGPINIGSGKPTVLKDLAERVVRVTGSHSDIRVVAAREVEVARFVASTVLQETVLGLQIPADPLEHLPKIMIERSNWRKSMMPK
jgi:UDP-glucose 4-epimerase